MGILYAQEHLSCYNYATLAESFFTVVSLKKEEVLERKSLSVALLVFVTSGSMEVSTIGCLDKRIGAGQFFLLTKGASCRGVVREDTVLLVCRLSNELKLCNRYSFQQLASYVPKGYTYEFLTLDFTHRITDFVRMLMEALNDGLGCVHFHQLKRDELLLYLRVEYTKENLARFFLPIVGTTSDFKDFVITNYRKVRSIKELAERANLSLSTFNRRFQEAFQKSPQEWMTVRRSEDVLKNLVMTSLPFAEVAEKHNFSSVSYLNTFCKKHFGKTPAELRKNGIAP